MNDSQQLLFSVTIYIKKTIYINCTSQQLWLVILLSHIITPKISLETKREWITDKLNIKYIGIRQYFTSLGGNFEFTYERCKIGINWPICTRKFASCKILYMQSNSTKYRTR